MSKKLNLSMVDRSQAVNMIPCSGNITEVEKYVGWLKELEMTDEEKEIEKSFNQIHNKDEQGKAINDWYNTTKEIELSDELYDYIKSVVIAKNDGCGIGITDSLNLYKEFLNE